MKVLRWLCLPAFLAVLVVAGCRSNDKSYDVKGKVVAVDGVNKTVTLDHQGIPDFQQAGKFQFTVEDVKLLADIQVGDEVHGRFTVRIGTTPPKHYIITELHKR
jgi:Cu/Ag efflux protein CusF